MTSQKLTEIDRMRPINKHSKILSLRGKCGKGFYQKYHQLFVEVACPACGNQGKDVFVNEPYGGELSTLDNCYFTCHMGSCTVDCRFEMEKLAAEEAVRFIRGEELQLQVSEYEYELKQIPRQNRNCLCCGSG